MNERGFSGSEIRWLACYFASSWLTNFGHGLVVTVVGPTQLYVSTRSGYLALPGKEKIIKVYNIV